MLKSTRTITDSLELLLPSRCLVCGRRIFAAKICKTCIPEGAWREYSGQTRCQKCFTNILNNFPEDPCQLCRILPSPFLRTRFIWKYSGCARDYIAAMKYRPSVWLCKQAGEILAEALPLLFPDYGWDLIVPLPSTISSLQTRGFNQCLILARQIAREWGGTISPMGLRHLGSRAAQASLRPAQRIGNVRNSFVAGPQVAARKILLIDDVITTGATSSSAALALLKAGAQAVDLLALARAATWEQHRQRVYDRIVRRFGKNSNPVTKESKY